MIGLGLYYATPGFAVLLEPQMEENDDFMSINYMIITI